MFSMCAVCTWTIKSQALPKGDLQLTQCNHLGLGGLLELVEAEFEDKEDEVVVVVLEAIEAAEATDPEVKPEKKKKKLWKINVFAQKHHISLMKPKNLKNVYSNGNSLGQLKWRMPLNQM